MITRLLHLALALLAGITLAGCRTSPASKPRTAPTPAREPELEFEPQVAAYAHYAQGVVEQMNGRAAEAMEQFHAAAKLDPGNDDLVLQVARTWLLQKKPERALEILKRGAAQPQADPMLDVLLGTAYLQTGKTNLAAEANLRAIRKAPTMLAGYQNLHAGYLLTGHADQAIEALDLAGRQRGVDAEFLIGLAELYVNLAVAVPATRTNAHPKALALLQRADGMTVTNLTTRVKLADGFYVLGEGEKAAALYQALLAEHPQAPMLQENVRGKLTNIYLRGRDPRRALEQLEAIVRESPMNAQARYFLALLASETGDTARAEEQFRQVLVLNPKFEQAYYDLAMAQLNLAKTNEVFATLATAQKNFKPNFISEFLLGVASAQTGNLDESVRRFTSAEIIARAKDTNRLTAVFYYQFGTVLERRGSYSESVKCMEKALELQPDFPPAANHLGYMWAERGENLERAKALIERAVQAEPKNEAYLDSLAWVLFKLGRPREALPVMRQAVALAEAAKKPDAALYDHLGDICAALGDTVGARAAWEQALQLAPSEEIRKKLERAKSP